MVKRSGRGTARQSVRVEEKLWERFGQVARERGTDRSTVLRTFIESYVGDEQGADEPSQA